MNTSDDSPHPRSLKETCTLWLEQLILSGELQAGERLPSERDLASQLGISRPVLHEALADLAAMGLVTVLPRRGVVINDFRKSGSFAILSSLLVYNQGKLDPAMVRSLFEMRALIETETARLAATAASSQEIAALRDVLEKERRLDFADIPTRVGLDFEFHLLVAVASGNLIYPLVINSFKSIYVHFAGEFYNRSRGSPVIAEVYAFQHRLVDAIEQRDPCRAAEIMAQMLAHGEQHTKPAAE